MIGSMCPRCDRVQCTCDPRLAGLEKQIAELKAENERLQGALAEAKDRKELQETFNLNIDDVSTLAFELSKKDIKFILGIFSAVSVITMDSLLASGRSKSMSMSIMLRLLMS
jgi:hypothetical protein